jgi:hypothetical protein
MDSTIVQDVPLTPFLEDRSLRKSDIKAKIPTELIIDQYQMG